MKASNKVIFKDSGKMDSIPSESVDLIVTSPPYPMIKMWDNMFCSQNRAIDKALKSFDGFKAFELMHRELDRVWSECYRVLKYGGFICINIGDATRTIGENFRLYSNHTRILHHLLKLGFSALPDILWRKQTNAPNKFMGSGMLPAGPYVTLEHEYILIARKGSKREFMSNAEKKNRRESAIFWEERNTFFSDVWMDIKGARQELGQKELRMRSAAFPFELAYRIISMYSVKGDVVLDPFLGTGTTMAAAMAAGRNSIGYEINPQFKDTIHSISNYIVEFSNRYIQQRLKRHVDFVLERIKTDGPLKHANRHYLFPVMTSQEKDIIINELLDVEKKGKNIFEVLYSPKPQPHFYRDWGAILGQDSPEIPIETNYDTPSTKKGKIYKTSDK